MCIRDSLNGSTEFTDYGRYETVSNLSTTDQPQLTDEGVTWTLSDPDVYKRQDTDFPR